MKSIALASAPEYYHNYINLVNEEPIIEQLEEGGIAEYLQIIEQLEALGDKVYAQGKWTIKQIVQHLIDTERLFVARCLRFLRQDKTPIPGYDHDAYAIVARVDHVSLSDLIEEYQILRMSTYLFFKNLSQEEWTRSGTANNKEISIVAMAYVIIGHPLHHLNVIEERYLGL
jgi:hypothetical protein